MLGTAENSELRKTREPDWSVRFWCSFWAGFRSTDRRTNILISKHAAFVLDDRGIAISPHSTQLPLLCSYTNMSGTYLYLPGNSDFSMFPLVRKAFGKVKGIYWMWYHSNTYAMKTQNINGISNLDGSRRKKYWEAPCPVSLQRNQLPFHPDINIHNHQLYFLFSLLGFESNIAPWPFEKGKLPVSTKKLMSL